MSTITSPSGRTRRLRNADLALVLVPTVRGSLRCRRCRFSPIRLLLEW